MLSMAKTARTAAVTRRTVVDVKKVGIGRGVAIVKRA
jgi:hypothetical protein